MTRAAKIRQSGAPLILPPVPCRVVKWKDRHTDKRARVIAQTDLFAGGSVRFPQRAAWLEEFTAELLAFPGRHDDQVDALTQGLAWGRQKRGEFSVSFARGLY